jgi:hypothetical protein
MQKTKDTFQESLAIMDKCIQEIDKINHYLRTIDNRYKDEKTRS